MTLLIAGVMAFFGYKMLMGGLNIRKLQSIIKTFGMLILAILLIKFGITTLIILGALFFVATSLLPRNIDINQFFKGFSGVEFGSGARYQQYYNNTSSAANGDTLEQEEAYKILGLKGGESKEEINKAYKKMMARFHPDKEGGSEYFAQKINQARDVLLKKYAK